MVQVIKLIIPILVQQFGAIRVATRQFAQQASSSQIVMMNVDDQQVQTLSWVTSLPRTDEQNWHEDFGALFPTNEKNMRFLPWVSGSVGQ